MDTAEIDVPDETLSGTPLVQDLDRAPVFEERDARLRRSGVDEELFPQAFAERSIGGPVKRWRIGGTRRRE